LFAGREQLLVSAVRSSFTARSAEMVNTLHRATKHLTGSFNRKTRSGACAIWKKLLALRRRTTSGRRRSTRCRQTTCRSPSTRYSAAGYHWTASAADSRSPTPRLSTSPTACLISVDVALRCDRRASPVLGNRAGADEQDDRRRAHCGSGDVIRKRCAATPA